MDEMLIKLYQEVVVCGKGVLLVENKNWGNYIRAEFAGLRKAIKEVEKRQNETKTN